MPINGFLQYLKEEKRYSSHTLTSYRCDLGQFCNFLEVYVGSFKVEAVRRDDVRAWIVYLMEQGISARSMNRKLSTLKSFFKYLRKRQICEADPMLGVVTPKIPKRIPHFVKEQEMDQLLDQVVFGEDFEGVRDQVILEVLYLTGVRLSELIGLKIEDVDFYKDQFRVMGKRQKERLIPFSRPLRKSLQKYLLLRERHLGENKSSFLFVTPKGDPAYPKLIYRIVNRYLGMVTTQAKKSPHVLRHTFATVLLNKGAELNAVKELLGHSSLAATEVYTHSTFEQLRHIYKQAHPRA